MLTSAATFALCPGCSWMPCTKAVQVHLHKRKLAPLYLFFTLNEGKPLFFFFLFLLLPFPFPSLLSQTLHHSIQWYQVEVVQLPALLVCLKCHQGMDGGTRRTKMFCRHTCGGVNQQAKGCPSAMVCCPYSYPCSALLLTFFVTWLPAAFKKASGLLQAVGLTGKIAPKHGMAWVLLLLFGWGVVVSVLLLL